ncbi:adenylyltransferase/cytidyltransferase family protein [Microcoleus sp. PH2017_18_LLB_O_A]|uniref:adenylyltransferase/cytidyltransferase family protein n=1 Tax=Microcoleus sp. PH2017_18_LLB_O_A TaxID=2798829 RepID=UPI001D94D4E3|nr:adenylyltransferase/cytidyltransferase family protein [Microcoleus sp. PH2017_18_LLB_O_A]MCC3517124.1 adenylyltransferase/cytidyltransferase family protein [Microcoleus sp. PH2017_18_LLB_O_A]
MISGVYTLGELERSIASDPQKWRPMVFTNGCFDILHAGHVRYLQAAKALGRSLVVGLNSDVSVQTIKPQQPGLPPRPIVPEIQRAEVLAALKPVDGVVIFSEITATKLISILKPEIYVKGGDYQLESLPEAPAVIEIEVPSSTSAIVKRILQLGV